MTYELSIEMDQLNDLIGHLERVRTYYTAEAAALSRAARPGTGTAAPSAIPWS
ncbi:MAG: hypothetical protein K2O93_07280 [Oscillospiraceae bacterium]|nr:hypothetical protein [Oscillospiraceae bacterium]